MTARIFVVEDDQALRELLRAYLERDGFSVDTFADGLGAWEAAEKKPPDLMLLDLMLPEMDGIEVMTRVREHLPQVATIMVTARTTEQDRIKGLTLGADDYVVKPFSPAEVVLRVRAVLRRLQDTHQESGAPLTSGPIALDSGRHLVSVHDRPIDLTPTEFKLLEALMGRPGWTFTRQQLVDLAIGPDFLGFDRNIDVHVANLRRKLGLRPSPIHTVYGVGYRLDPDAAP